MIARYIDVEIPCKHYKALANIEWNKKVAPVSWVDAYNEFVDYLEELPTADVEEVVRCKDCENRVGDINACCDIYCSLHLRWFDKNAFCSYGERR